MSENAKFPGAKTYWHNGKLYQWDECIVHPMSHVMHYGSSVFEGIRAYMTDRGPAIFRLKDHIDRFFISAEAINMQVPYDADTIVEVCRMVLRENLLTNAYIRPNLFYGYGNLGLTPASCPVELTVGCWEWGRYLGEASLQNGVHTLLLPQKRIHHSQMNASVKLGGLYVQSNIYATEARRRGFDEAIFLNLEERISEGPGENIIIVNGDTLRTNDRYESVLEGITRTSILEIARRQGYRTEIAPITVEDLLGADEAFFTGTAAEVTPISRVTDSRNRELPQEKWEMHALGTGKPGKVTLEMARLYNEIIHGRHQEHDEWLTDVYDTPEAAHHALNGLVEKKGQLTS